MLGMIPLDSGATTYTGKNTGSSLGIERQYRAESRRDLHRVGRVAYRRMRFLTIAQRIPETAFVCSLKRSFAGYKTSGRWTLERMGEVYSRSTLGITT